MQCTSVKKCGRLDSSNIGSCRFAKTRFDGTRPFERAWIGVSVDPLRLQTPSNDKLTQNLDVYSIFFWLTCREVDNCIFISNSRSDTC